MKLKVLIKRQALIHSLIFIFVLFVFYGCATELKERKLEVEGFTLMYKAQKLADSEIKDISITHPIKISLESMTSQLLSLKFLYIIKN